MYGPSVNCEFGHILGIIPWVLAVFRWQKCSCTLYKLLQCCFVLRKVIVLTDSEVFRQIWLLISIFSSKLCMHVSSNLSCNGQPLYVVINLVKLNEWKLFPHIIPPFEVQGFSRFISGNFTSGLDLTCGFTAQMAVIHAALIAVFKANWDCLVERLEQKKLKIPSLIRDAFTQASACTLHCERAPRSQ